MGGLPMEIGSGGLDEVRLKSRQVAGLVLLGVVFWLLAALLVRWAGPTGLLSGGPLAALYLAALPSLAAAIWIGRALVGFRRREAFEATAVMTGTALLLDGMALVVARGLYGTDPTTVLSGAALILWGAGVGLALAAAWAWGAR